MFSENLVLLIAAVCFWPLIALIGGAIYLWDRIKPTRHKGPAR